MFQKIKFTYILGISIAIALIILYINYQLFFAISEVYSIINMIAIVIAIGVPLFHRYLARMRIKQIEEMFPRFLRDVTESLNSGMTLPQAFKSVSSNDYGIMTTYVKDMSAKISFGIPFEKVLENFAEEVNTPAMRRSVQMILETHKSGGTVATVLAAVSESLQELEKLKKQRVSSIYSQMINGYIIYIIFLGIMISLSSFLMPTFEIDIIPNLQNTFNELFLSLIIVQGFFSGIAIGKLSEGTFLAGVKHAAILVVVGYSAFILFG
jgi:flagellar protein FlaJ